MSQSIAASRTGVIENLFRKYPDTPQESIIKQDLLILGEGFSESALAAAANAEKKNYNLFSHDLVPMSSMQRQEYLKAPECFATKGGPYELRPMCTHTVISPDSPYLIDVIDGRLKLLLDGVAIADVGYSPPLKYYSKSFSDGTSYSDIIARGSSVIPFRLCQLWGEEKECKFCDMNENTRQVSEFKSRLQASPVKPVERVAVVANEIGREVLERDGYQAPIDFYISGGTITDKLHGLTEEDFYLQYVEAVKSGGHRRHITLSTGSADKETAKRYHRVGVDSHWANLEVWDKRLFEWICPGKSERVGWEEWVKRLLDSVDIFGEGNVCPTIIGGLEMAQPYGFKTINEAVKSTTEGLTYLMSHGVMPRINLWRRQPGTFLVKNYSQPPVSPEYAIELMRNYYENWKRYGLPLPRRISACPELRVLAREHGFRDDYLILMEQKDYGNLALQALENAGYIWGYNPKDANLQVRLT
ncbi:MAG: radical SAM protein [Candidatus Aenigmatarchaeota archaeon]